MLQTIRDKTHGLIAGIIISILILSFALWGIHSYLDAGGSTNTVAKVNGVEINKSQLAVSYERLRRQMQIQNNGNIALPLQAEASLKNQALQNLITIQLLKQASMKDNYRISLEQVESLLESMPEFQVNDRFSMERFQQILSTTLYTPSDFLDLLHASLLIDQPRLGVVFTSFALPSEIDNAITLVNQERDISFANIPLASFLSQPLTVSQDQIATYYRNHPDEFKTAEQVSIEYIQLNVNNLMKTINASEAEAKNFYDENVNSFAESAQWQLAAILIPLSPSANQADVDAATKKLSDIQMQIKTGQSFEKFAEQNPATTLKLPTWVSLNQAPPELQRSIMSLTKPNQVSADAIRTNQGLVLLKSLQIKEAQVLPYEKVKDKVKQAYARQKAQEKFAELKEKLANSTYEHPDSLKTASTELNIPVETTDVFTRDKGNSDISSHDKVREAAFSPDVLTSQNNSDVIPVNADTAIVLRIKTHVPAAVLPLSSVENQITDKLKNAEAEKLAEAKAKDIAKKLSQGEHAIAATVNWKDLGFIGRRATQIDAAILDKAFSMPRPRASMLTVYATAKTPDGYAVVALKGVKDGDASKKDQTEIFAEQIQNAQGALEYALYKESIIKDAKIVIENPQSDQQ